MRASAEVTISGGGIEGAAKVVFSGLLAQIQEFWQPLPDKPEETAEAALRALWCTACGEPISVARAHGRALPDLDGDKLERLRGLIERKRNGVPLAHLTERQAFMGVELLAGPQALIPRAETEILGHAALDKIRDAAEHSGAALVLDLCTGSGNLAVAYAYHERRTLVHAADLSPDAVHLARLNCVHTNLSTRIAVCQGNLFDPFESPEFLGACDFISCNPPYISAAKVKTMHPEIALFEPQAAFNGGVYGVSVLMRLVAAAPRFLKPDGWLGFEVGVGQGPTLSRQLAKNPNYSAVETFTDSSSQIRAILAKAAGQTLPRRTNDPLRFSGNR